MPALAPALERILADRAFHRLHATALRSRLAAKKERKKVGGRRLLGDDAREIIKFSASRIGSPAVRALCRRGGCELRLPGILGRYYNARVI